MKIPSKRMRLNVKVLIPRYDKQLVEEGFTFYCEPSSWCDQCKNKFHCYTASKKSIVEIDETETAFGKKMQKILAHIYDKHVRLREEFFTYKCRPYKLALEGKSVEEPSTAEIMVNIDSDDIIFDRCCHFDEDFEKWFVFDCDSKKLTHEDKDELFKIWKKKEKEKRKC